METEKVCINLPAVELGKIDVLVGQGLFSSRTDLIREGIRVVLRENEDAMKAVDAWLPRIGYQILSRAELEGARAQGRPLQVVAVGVLRVEASVTPELADEAVEQIRLFGSIRGPKAVLDVLEPKIVRGFGGGDGRDREFVR